MSSHVSHLHQLQPCHRQLPTKEPPLQLVSIVAASSAPQVAQISNKKNGVQKPHRSSTYLMGKCCLTASCRAGNAALPQAAAS